MRKIKVFLRALRRDESGITGLETAIILIAFVVVASIFAYTVLTAGMFSSQTGQEAVYSGIEESRSTIEIKGNTVVKANSTSCTEMIFNVASALDGSPMDFTAPADVDSNGLADSGSTNVLVIAYNSQGYFTNDLAWTKTGVGRDDGDDMLENGEVFQISVDLSGVGEAISIYKKFSIELKPPRGSTIKIERTTPGALDTVMILH